MKSFLFLAPFWAVLSLTTLPARAQSPVPKLRQVVWIWLENTPDATMSAQKYLKGLWQRVPAARFTKFLPVSKVTQANGVALLTGSDQGIRDDELMRLFVPTLIDLLESRNLSWRVYAEDYPGSCFVGAGTGDYQRSRVPFISIAKVQSDRYLCSKIVNFRNLELDRDGNQLPVFSVVIPNLSNSGAISNVATAELAVRKIIDPIVSNADRLRSTTIIVSSINNLDPKKPEMYLLIAGAGVAAKAQSVPTPYNHYHLLRTLEDGFRLGHLNQNDVRAEPMVGFWAE